MHTTGSKNRFLELRSKGISLARIARHLNVSKRTLVTWNQQHAEQLRTMRAIQLEALQEKLLSSEKSELIWLSTMLEKAEQALLGRELKYESATDLWRIQSQLRAEIRQRRIACDHDFSKSTINDEDDSEVPSPPTDAAADPGIHTPALERTDSVAPALPQTDRAPSDPSLDLPSNDNIDPSMN